MSDYIMPWTDTVLKPLPVVVSPMQHTSARTSLSLVGKGKFSYGDLVQVNFMRLLENFASIGKPPNNPTIGQLWFNAEEKVLKIYYDDVWYNVSTYINEDEPIVKQIGDLWFDLTENILKNWDGYQWVAIGTKVGTDAPNNPSIGQLWYNDSSKQMSYWTGEEWKVIDSDALQNFINKLDEKVNKSGDNMTGFLSLFDYPKQEMDAANKGYIDRIVENLQSDVNKGSVVIDTYYQDVTKPTRIIGPFPWVYAPNRSTLIVFIQGVKQKIDISYKENSINTIEFFEEIKPGNIVEVLHFRSGVEQFIEIAGDTMEGPLILHQDPINPLEAATKNYVDQVRVQLEQKFEELILNSGGGMSPLSATKRYYFGSLGQ